MDVILELKFGSHLYGTSTPKSDLDFKGIYIPSAREIVLGTFNATVQVKRNKAHGERNTKDDVDREYVSLNRFMELLCEGQTMALDMLFAPKEMRTFEDPRLIWIFDRIYDSRHEFVNKNVNAFVGYAKQQAARYGIKGSRMDALRRVLNLLSLYPGRDKLWSYEERILELVATSKELVSLEKTPLIEVVDIKGPRGTPEKHLSVANRKIPFHATVQFARQVYQRVYDEYGARAVKVSLSGGRDYKALSHAIRVNAEAKELLETGHITFPRPEAELLLAVKNEQVPFEKVSEIIEKGLADLMDAQPESKLRERPNLQAAQDLVYEVYAAQVRGELG